MPALHLIRVSASHVSDEQKYRTHIKTSRRSWTNRSHPLFTEARERKSISKNVIPTDGLVFFISVMSASPALALRPVK